MKRSCFLIVALCIALFEAQTAAAQQYTSFGTWEGVEVLTQIDPLGPNNQIGAYVKFVNHNKYKVNIEWTPLITCAGQTARKSYGEPFSIDAEASYEATIWRSSTCHMGSIKELEIEIKVKRADSY